MHRLTHTHTHTHTNLNSLLPIHLNITSHLTFRGALQCLPHVRCGALGWPKGVHRGS
ncbi:hypothetical protein E2C01_080124 [Portunus trituberculatus]|uniref:Uncharacterized protein n=1 Tax=Portunus trituberculatus TaxID=210409 RepID=A0A5B7ISB7_PORTR|nr:hypothetical protein [Portunus trituberculatus]